MHGNFSPVPIFFTTYSLMDATQSQQMVEVLKTVQHTAACGPVYEACFPIWTNAALIRAVFYVVKMEPLNASKGSQGMRVVKPSSEAETPTSLQMFCKYTNSGCTFLWGVGEKSDHGGNYIHTSLFTHHSGLISSINPRPRITEGTNL